MESFARFPVSETGLTSESARTLWVSLAKRARADRNGQTHWTVAHDSDTRQ